jgi:hypothetical protein
MKKLHIELANCYGIKAMTADLDFAQHRAYAVYAPNGVMKSSLAHTFKDLSEGVASKDVIFPARVSMRTITDENNKAIAKEEVLVVAPSWGCSRSDGSWLVSHGDMVGRR